MGASVEILWGGPTVALVGGREPGEEEIVAAVRPSELREQIGRTQTELARVPEMTRPTSPGSSTRENLYLRTPADYVGAPGGRIEVNTVFDDDVVPLGPVEGDRGSVAA
jgi:hypothetical protein